MSDRKAASAAYTVTGMAETAPNFTSSSSKRKTSPSSAGKGATNTSASGRARSDEDGAYRKVGSDPHSGGGGRDRRGSDIEENAHDTNGHAQKKSPKKRRKVNHACVYCRRSHMTCDLDRPCTRCIKRNIGHLCHDEPREADTKKTKAPGPGNDEVSHAVAPTSRPNSGSMGPPLTPGFGSANLSTGNSLSHVPPGTTSGIAGGNALEYGPSSNTNQFAGFSDAWMTAQNFQDMSNYNPNYMIAPEVSHEFHLLNHFLHTSMLDDNGVPIEDPQQGAIFSGNPNQLEMSTSSGMASEEPAQNDGNRMLQGVASNGNVYRDQQSLAPPSDAIGRSISRPRSAAAGDKDKTREYYLQAADPTGNDTPEERMFRVLRAKYEAGLLKPFNYINGYARLGKYLDGHIAATSKQKILRTINQFRPKFREKAQGLTDMQLVYVEMWFERQLMDLDRVFASMAVPACCWRRTGEIFRGNKEMAELINVPVDQLRDGKIALHEILTEESLVRYWEEFGTIAFDPQHDTLLTACSLKNPSDTSSHPIVKCCFSFNIRRDEHKLPALIVGNFLPHDPNPH